MQPIISKEAIVWNTKGKLQLVAKDPAKAIECFNKSIQISKNYASAWNNKGLALKQQGKILDAIANYEKAIELDPLFDKAWFNKASACHQVQRHLEAIKCCEKTLECNPKYFKAWYKKGSSLILLEKYEEALVCFEKVLEIDPNNAEASKKKKDVEERISVLKIVSSKDNSATPAESGVNCADESIEKLKQIIAEVNLNSFSLEQAKSLEYIAEAFFAEVKYRRLELERTQTPNLCVICADRDRSMICIPCGHVCMCFGCSKKMKSNDCPICKQKFEKIIKVYL